MTWIAGGGLALVPESGHGGYDIQWLDLRSTSAACGTAEDGVSADATRHSPTVMVSWKGDYSLCLITDQL